MKRGQIQSGELIMVVVIVMVIFMLGISFYGNIKAKQIKEKGVEISSLNAVDLAQEVISLPEIACSHIIESTDCVDALRVEELVKAMRAMRPDSDEFNYYRLKFGSAKIIVERSYPEYEEWVIYDTSRNTSRTQLPLRIPIHVYDAVRKTNSFGVLTVVKYS